MESYLLQLNALFRLSKTTDGHGTHTHTQSLGAAGIVLLLLLWVIRLNIKPRVFSLGDFFFFFLFLDCFHLDDGPADRERVPQQFGANWKRPKKSKKKRIGTV